VAPGDSSQVACFAIRLRRPCWKVAGPPLGNEGFAACNQNGAERHIVVAGAAIERCVLFFELSRCSGERKSCVHVAGFAGCFGVCAGGCPGSCWLGCGGPGLLLGGGSGKFEKLPRC
jgi:hypothetical protein